MSSPADAALVQQPATRMMRATIDSAVAGHRPIVNLLCDTGKLPSYVVTAIRGMFQALDDWREEEALSR